ncbi:helix-turn-helix transcriptional regulator [Bdellovibrio bacteriovorus]|uniref:helix-turn-helix transcriptional regulator n=1 Tax=Bdellovibrio TaxID=958 RepID=UPI0035A94277
MKSLHENQRKILEHLLHCPEGASLEELATVLKVTKTAAKEHIIKVETLGYVTYVDSRGSVGRPKRRYLLSNEGHDVFPKQYSWLSNVLLELLAEDMGAKQVSEIMNKLAGKVANSMQARFENCTSTADRLRELTKTLNELGYRATLKQSDLRKGAVIEATNCVYHSVAKQHPELCQFDIRFIRNATGLNNVKLESCIARGGSVCRFCIRKST